MNGVNERHAGAAFVIMVFSAVAFGFNGADAAQTTDIFVVDYSDPANDVMVFYYNGTNSTDSEHSFLDFKKLTSVNNTDAVSVMLELKGGTIFNNSDEVKYVIRVFTNAENSTGYNLTYCNNTLNIVNFTLNMQGAMNANINNFSFSSTGEVLTVNLSKEMYLSNVTSFYLDAYTVMKVKGATYIDSITPLSGNPGVIPPDVIQNNTEPTSEEDDGSPGFGTAVVMGSVASTACAFIYVRRRKN